MTTNLKKSSKKGFQLSGGIVILCCFAIAWCIFNFIFGASGNFMNNDSANAPMPGNLLGTVYKGGFIVPVILTLLLTVLTLSVERFIAISKAKGKGNLTAFVASIKESLAKGDINGAKELCNKQKGSVANVVNSGLDRYAQMEADGTLSKEQKVVAIQKEIEEATALEMPSLEQNLPIIATMTTLGTLMGLLGTVIGMIKSFAALANAGSVDSLALSTGISEALVNTAFGIATGASAVIAYNYFTTVIDGITYCIDEVGFTIVQNFNASHK